MGCIFDDEDLSRVISADLERYRIILYRREISIIKRGDEMRGFVLKDIDAIRDTICVPGNNDG